MSRSPNIRFSCCQTLRIIGQGCFHETSMILTNAPDWWGIPYQCWILVRCTPHQFLLLLHPWSWDPWDLGPWLSDFAMGSCRSWILTFYFIIGSSGSWILIFGRGTIWLIALSTIHMTEEEDIDWLNDMHGRAMQFIFLFWKWICVAETPQFIFCSCSSQLHYILHSRCECFFHSFGRRVAMRALQDVLGGHCQDFGMR